MDGFIVVGNTNACTYNEVFPLFKSGKARLGYVANRSLLCKLPEDAEDYLKKDDEGNKLCNVNPVSWFVTFPVEKKPLVLSKTYNPTDYPKYDNFDAIEVSKVTDIPKDYDGVMGVPITFLGKYNPNQFEILDLVKRYMVCDYFGVNEDVRNRHSHCTNIDGKATYARILIRKVKELPTEEEVKNKEKRE